MKKITLKCSGVTPLGIKNSDYKKFFSEIKARVVQARYEAYRAVNKELICLYWDIGKGIVEKQERLGWGEAVVERLSLDLQREFAGVKGLSAQNLWRMKQFYVAYSKNEKLSALLRELSWTQNLYILHRAKTVEEKEFYIKTCIHERWSSRELERQLDSALFERYMLSRKPRMLVAKTKEKNPWSQFKSEYVLDFLGLQDGFQEKDLRKAIVGNLRHFFLEFGRNFTFVGEEYPVIIGGEDFKIDLVFYHRELRCLVAVELKIGAFKPEYVGKMQFYLEALDRKIKLEHENPSVGIILCKDRNKEVVEIAMSRAASPMQVSLYKTEIIDQRLLKRRLHGLPQLLR
jgi:predicted nuclease of restriction endonuclease-like (RecB) superfamily